MGPALTEDNRALNHPLWSPFGHRYDYLGVALVFRFLTDSIRVRVFVWLCDRAVLQVLRMCRSFTRIMNVPVVVASSVLDLEVNIKFVVSSTPGVTTSATSVCRAVADDILFVALRQVTRVAFTRSSAIGIWDRFESWTMLLCAIAICGCLSRSIHTLCLWMNGCSRRGCG